jgi:hypothetical protein
MVVFLIMNFMQNIILLYLSLLLIEMIYVNISNFLFNFIPKCLYCGEPTISLHFHHVSLVQWTTCLLPITRDPGSNPLGVLM